MPSTHSVVADLVIVESPRTAKITTERQPDRASVTAGTDGTCQPPAR